MVSGATIMQQEERAWHIVSREVGQRTVRKRSMKQEDGINSTDRGSRGTQKRKYVIEKGTRGISFLLSDCVNYSVCVVGLKLSF